MTNHSKLITYLRGIYKVTCQHCQRMTVVGQGAADDMQDAAAALEAQGAEIERLRAAIERSGLDMSGCNGCSELVIYCGDGLPYCAKCAEGLNG